MNFEYFFVSLPGLFWICIITPALFALGGVCLARKLIGPDYRQQHHDIANAVIGPVATIFGIMAAFINILDLVQTMDMTEILILLKMIACQEFWRGMTTEELFWT